MTLYERVFTEGLQRDRRRGKVTLGQLPDYLAARPTILPTARQAHSGNWPTKTGRARDPKLDYKIASHTQRSVHGPSSAGRKYRDPEHVATTTSPPLKTKALKRTKLLAKRKALQAKRERDKK